MTLCQQSRIRTLLFAGACVIALSSCATTINSAYSTATTSPGSITTTTIPTGSLVDLLKQMLITGAELGNDVAEGNSASAKAKVADIKAIWIGASSQIESLSKETIADLQRMVDLFISSVERKRPADADKAMRYLPLIMASL